MSLATEYTIGVGFGVAIREYRKSCLCRLRAANRPHDLVLRESLVPGAMYEGGRNRGWELSLGCISGSVACVGQLWAPLKPDLSHEVAVQEWKNRVVEMGRLCAFAWMFFYGAGEKRWGAFVRNWSCVLFALRAV